MYLIEKPFLLASIKHFTSEHPQQQKKIGINFFNLTGTIVRRLERAEKKVDKLKYQHGIYFIINPLFGVPSVTIEFILFSFSLRKYEGRNRSRSDSRIF